jgi:hypothetical protein
MTDSGRTLQKSEILRRISSVTGVRRAADEDVGLDADLAQLAHRLLRGLGLQLAAGRQVDEQREVDEGALAGRVLDGVLPDGLEEGQALDVAHRAADLGDDDVDVRRAELVDGGLDLVGDVRHDLHGLAQVLARALLADDRLVDLAGREIAVLGERRVREALVVPEVEVHLGAVVEHVDLAVLVGVHRARVDVDVRIELLHPHAQAAVLEDAAQARGGETLAERGHDAAGHEDVLGHEAPPGTEVRLPYLRTKRA